MRAAFSVMAMASMLLCCGWTRGIWPARDTSPRKEAWTNGANWVVYAKDAWTWDCYSAIVERIYHTYSVTNFSVGSIIQLWTATNTYRTERERLCDLKTLLKDNLLEKYAHRGTALDLDSYLKAVETNSTLSLLPTGTPTVMPINYNDDTVDAYYQLCGVPAGFLTNCVGASRGLTNEAPYRDLSGAGEWDCLRAMITNLDYALAVDLSPYTGGVNTAWITNINECTADYSVDVCSGSSVERASGNTWPSLGWSASKVGSCGPAESTGSVKWTENSFSVSTWASATNALTAVSVSTSITFASSFFYRWVNGDDPSQDDGGTHYSLTSEWDLVRYTLVCTPFVSAQRTNYWSYRASGEWMNVNAECYDATYNPANGSPQGEVSFSSYDESAGIVVWGLNYD